MDEYFNCQQNADDFIRVFELSNGKEYSFIIEENNKLSEVILKKSQIKKLSELLLESLK